jgi:hypothetical protein
VRLDNITSQLSHPSKPAATVLVGCMCSFYSSSPQQQLATCRSPGLQVAVGLAASYHTASLLLVHAALFWAVTIACYLFCACTHCIHLSQRLRYVLVNL